MKAPISAWRRAAVYVMTWPVDLLVWLVMVAVLRPWWGRSLEWVDGTLVLYMRQNSWPLDPSKRFGGWYRGWGGTTLLGHSVLLTHAAPVQLEEILEHELQHVEQFELALMIGFAQAIVLTCVGHVWIGMITWTLSSLIFYLCAMALAAIKGRKAYADNVLERSARALSGE